MMFLRSTLMLVSALVLGVVTVNGQAGKGGETGFDFLKLAVGARASALGSAYTALGQDATSTYWNPAGLARLQATHISFTHTEWLEGIANDYAAIAFPALGGGIGFAIYSNRVDGIERRAIPSEQPLGTVNADDLAASFSVARTFSNILDIGATFKYLYEKIYLESASGFAFDLGVQAQPFDMPLRFGAAVQNIGSVDELASESVSLPLIARFGAAYTREVAAVDGVLMLLVEGVSLKDAGFRTGFGFELLMKRYVALRAGYQTGAEEQTISGGFGFTANRFTIDYAYTPFDSNLGDTHRFTLAVQL